jgi:hypothetical protein
VEFVTGGVGGVAGEVGGKHVQPLDCARSHYSIGLARD